MKTREPRRNVIISARVRVSNVWFDTQIRNISSRGMMIDLKTPVPRGTYIEIARQEWRTAARVAWIGAGRCGVRTQDHVCLAELSSDTGRKARASDLESASPERRRMPVWTGRSIGRMLELAALVAAIAGFAFFVADEVHRSLTATIGRAAANL
ncbi:MAG TPA: PilZ domain-containing protein [Allosphingosinicella sp.]|nr:PilZ domain-containing protein [Allosphingosinicella sp.]